MGCLSSGGGVGAGAPVFVSGFGTAAVMGTGGSLAGAGFKAPVGVGTDKAGGLTVEEISAGGGGEFVSTGSGVVTILATSVNFALRRKLVVPVEGGCVTAEASVGTTLVLAESGSDLAGVGSDRSRMGTVMAEGPRVRLLNRSPPVLESACMGSASAMAMSVGVEAARGGSGDGVTSAGLGLSVDGLKGGGGPGSSRGFFALKKMSGQRITVKLGTQFQEEGVSGQVSLCLRGFCTMKKERIREIVEKQEALPERG